MTAPHQRSSRRTFITAAMCAPVLGMSTRLMGRPRAATALADPEQRLRAYMLMRGALDEKLVISCISCEYFGVVDAVMTPFYDLVAATFAKFRPAKTGGYDAVSFEIEYFVDRATGDVLDRWRNPYSGQLVTAKHTDSVPVKYRIEPDTRIGLPPALLMPGTEMSRATPRFEIAGDDVWVREETVASVPTPGANPIRFNEMVTYHAKLADLARPGASRTAADTSYLGVSSFRPWQAMGDRPGHIIGYGLGGSGLAMADLPPRWLAITKRRHPDALTDPEAYLTPLWKTL